jgi:hypothetical protein
LIGFPGKTQFFPVKNCNLIPQRNCDRFSRSSLNPRIVIELSKNWRSKNQKAPDCQSWKSCPDGALVSREALPARLPV